MGTMLISYKRLLGHLLIDAQKKGRKEKKNRKTCWIIKCRIDTGKFSLHTISFPMEECFKKHDMVHYMSGKEAIETVLCPKMSSTVFYGLVKMS